MLIVVAIIAILVAVSIPMVNSNLTKAALSTDKANLRAAKAAAMLDYAKGTEATVFTGYTSNTPDTDLKEGCYLASSGKIVAVSDGDAAAKLGKSSAVTGDEIGTDTEKAVIPQDHHIHVKVNANGEVKMLSWVASH